MSAPVRIAAIDIGTVTTRLLVGDVTDDHIEEVFRSTDITHLGEGLTQTGRLSEGAMLRVAEVISRYAEKIAQLGAVETAAVATSASRDAANGAEFLDMLASRGVAVRIISGDVEARLSFAGATSSLEGEGLLVVDVGGGSTELVFGSSSDSECDEAAIETARSIDVGSRRVTEMFLRADPPTQAQMDQAREWIASELKVYFDALRGKPRRMVALAGAATTLSAIHMEMVEYDAQRVHGSVLSGSDLAEITEMLARLPLERRREVVGLHPDRAPVIVGGCLVLESVLALAGLGEFTVSEHDILYGILLDTYDDLRERLGGRV
jgi:exopolyphosphatase/guanosine-5'-triphosphate,3'-diphosphate pyrophosphatase